MIGIAVRSGLSWSSDLRKKSDSAPGDCFVLSHDEGPQSSPEAGMEKEKPVKMGETGDPEPGDGAESVVSSAALQSSMELYTGPSVKLGSYVYVHGVRRMLGYG